MFSSRPTISQSVQNDVPLTPQVATEISQEYASLRAIGNCPTGMYLLPSPDSLLLWHGVFFVHQGPYAGSVLRFNVAFPTSFPQSGPTIRFDSDVFHPLVDPKTKIWKPHGRISRWQPRVDHIPQLLHNLKRSFKSQVLSEITEDEASNKQIWSLYHHSPQTFKSMTAQRSLHSTAASTLFPSSHPPLNPDGTASPQTLRGHKRSSSSLSSVYLADAGPITFRELSSGEEAGLKEGLRKSLGV